MHLILYYLCHDIRRIIRFTRANIAPISVSGRTIATTPRPTASGQGDAPFGERRVLVTGEEENVEQCAGGVVDQRPGQPRPPDDSLRVRCAIALLEAIRDGGWANFGICAGDPCTCVYVDRTRNHSRRYCSELCNNRVSQLAHRRRQSAAS